MPIYKLHISLTPKTTLLPSFVMESLLIPIFASLLLAVAVSHAALPSEIYWDRMLPNTPMPKAVRDLLLQPDFEDQKSTAVNVGKKDGVNVNTGKTKVDVGKGGVGVHTSRKGKPVNVGVHPGPDPFNYQYAASEDQLHADPNVALFFLDKDFQPGTKMNLHFTRTTTKSTFLPHQVAETIPFSSDKLSQVMDQFYVQPESIEAKDMKQTVKQCEEPAQEGEEKYCATSLESMVDFTTSKLGKHVHPMSTEVGKEMTPKQPYKIVPGVKKLGGESSVVCHSQKYAYAVFYCHKTQATKAYKVPLVGADGTKATAAAVCHTDTSKWNPKHLAFQVLKVKPGTVPVCHFLPEDHIVWVSY